MTASRIKLSEIGLGGFDDGDRNRIQKKTSVFLSALLKLEFGFKVGIHYIVVEKGTGIEDTVESIEYSRNLESQRYAIVRHGFSPVKYESSPQEYLLTIAHRSILHVLNDASVENSDLEAFDLAVARFRAQGNLTPIFVKAGVKRNRRYEVIPFILLPGGNYVNQAELYLTLSELSSDRRASLFLAQDNIGLIADLCVGTMIQKNQVVLKFKRTSLTDYYGRRGFRLPITVPIEDFGLTP